jgi:WD40 repeat protein
VRLILILRKAAVRCLDFDKTGNFLALGNAVGGVSILSYSPVLNPTSKSFPYVLKEIYFRKDAKEAILDIKFSPNANHLAAASNDSFIYIYSCVYNTTANYDGRSCALRPIHKLNGHSSKVGHIGNKALMVPDPFMILLS